MEENEGKEKKQKKKMQPKRWLGGFLGIFLAGLAGCMALVIWVDPFFQYHKPLAWFPYLVDNQVNQNPGLAKHMDYDGILIGYSMTASFNTDWFEELMGMKTQKLSYNGSYPKDLSNIMQLVFDAKGDQVKSDTVLGHTDQPGLLQLSDMAGQRSVGDLQPGCDLIHIHFFFF